VSATKIDVRIGELAVPVGELIYDVNGTRETAVFTYHESWLQNANAFALSPEMPLQAAPYYQTGAGNVSALPLPVGDGTPDSWGREIIRMAFRDEDGRGRTLTDLDYLTKSDDYLRSGALRYFDGPDADAVALAAPRPDQKGKYPGVPRLVEMDELINASRAFEADPNGYHKHRSKMMGGDLLAGVGSLGGARPKVNVRDENHQLWIAKLAKQGDTYAMSRTEVMAMRLASRVGITTAETGILPTSAQAYPVALVKRFDRTSNGARVPFISGQTFMGLHGTEPGNYVDLAHRMLTHCDAPKEQMAELHRRMMYTVLIQNADDHLRNHGFIASPNGKWALSPAYDINAVPDEGVTLKTAISDLHGNGMSIEAVIEVAPFFELTESEAAKSARKMAETIRDEWRGIGASLGMNSSDTHAIAPAMDNAQMDAALRLGEAKPAPKPVAKPPTPSSSFGP
jgi:serine/threonine-protein kinase HipA